MPAEKAAHASSIKHTRERTARERQHLKDLNEELAVASSIEGRIRNEVAASAGGPLPQVPEGEKAALMAMHVGACGQPGCSCSQRQRRLATSSLLRTSF